MGLSVTASHVIWFVAIVGLAGGILGAFFSVSGAMEHAEAARRAIDAERLDTFLGNATFCYDAPGQRLVVSGTNDGPNPLDITNLTFLVDGNVTSGFSATTQDAGAGTSLWAPGEWANFTLAPLATEPLRVAVSTEHGAFVRATKTACP